MPPFEALYGRPYTSPAFWEKSEDSVTIGPKIVINHTEKIGHIKQRLRVAQNGYK
ncbi:hypothetical protein Scep_023974 [Stephania cephalantha]|uniref:Uncharacterized protein n=1 Tax=Stephania cephalantha TaxID=152367 RepID=A0AAP0HXY5_9MAGN